MARETTLGEAIRKRSLTLLRRRRIRPAPALPLLEQRSALRTLRPQRDIALRAMAVDALFTWVAMSADKTPDARVRNYAKRNRLSVWMTKEERRIFALPRAQARRGHIDSVGWRLENLWALAWILGFKPAPEPDGRMIPERIIKSLFKFQPKLADTAAAFLKRTAVRKERAVFQREDSFYCAHNAGRNGAMGDDRERPDFDPVVWVGVIHERRHALTWALSPGVAWEDTDLNT